MSYGTPFNDCCNTASAIQLMMASTLSYVPRYRDLNVTYSNNTNATSTATVHYVEAGDPAFPTILLLHGFPSSSYQFRDLIPMYSDSYHVLAPDFPGFGLTKVASDFTYSFANITKVIAAWLVALGISKTAVYVHDYGAPVGFRLAISGAIEYSAIITQNGNAYEAGFGQDFWAPIFDIWNTSNSDQARKVVADAVLTLEGTKFQYGGAPAEDSDLVNPQAWTFNYLQNIQGDANTERQLNLFYDYRTNVELYPQFQKYFRDSQVPILAIWGKNDPAFIPAGASAFKRDSPGATVEFLDAGHTALESKRWEIARISRAFLSGIGW